MKLSICIATFKRADMIGETLDSIVPQLTDDVEVVVLDGASPDHTAEVVGDYAGRHPAIRYIRADTNSGVDADFDKAVQAARGRHCWLFSDDDTLVPGAVETVLGELAASDPDLLVVDAEVRDRKLDRLFEARRLPFEGRRSYAPADPDRMMGDLGNALSFIGCAIIRRSLWQQRDRQSYFGSLFVHVGTAFQKPLHAVALGQSLVRIRIANAMWTARGFEIWMFLWPGLIWGFTGFGDAAKAAVTPAEPWRDPKKLLLWRAHGVYGPAEYRRFLAPRAGPAERVWMRAIAWLPGKAVHMLVAGLLRVRGHAGGSVAYQLMEGSPFGNALSRALVRSGGAGR